jgi:hypothetical protein
MTGAILAVGLSSVAYILAVSRTGSLLQAVGFN